MKKLMLIAALLSLTACGGFNTTDTITNNVPATPPPATDQNQQDINSLVSAENDYREGLGQTMLSPGLSCTLQTFTAGDRIQSSISGHNTLSGLSTVATFLYDGAFNQPDMNTSSGMNVLPAVLQPIYQTYYKLVCRGQIVIQTSDYYGFQLSSDDASLLYIDGSKVIDSDNNHGITQVNGQKYLRRGVHTFELDYAQNQGDEALILNAAEGTATPGSIPGNLYYH